VESARREAVRCHFQRERLALARANLEERRTRLDEELAARRPEAAGLVSAVAEAEAALARAQSMLEAAAGAVAAARAARAETARVGNPGRRRTPRTAASPITNGRPAASPSIWRRSTPARTSTACRRARAPSCAPPTREMAMAPHSPVLSASPESYSKSRPVWM